MIDLSAGLCARHPDRDLWFSDNNTDRLAAKRVCRVCPVQVECLSFAIESRQEWGIWGGESAAGRRRIAAGASPVVDPAGWVELERKAVQKANQRARHADWTPRLMMEEAA